MQKEFVVTAVSASDMQTEVVVSLLDTKLLEPQKSGRPDDPYPGQPPSFYYVSRELGTRIILSYLEYEESGLRVGDRVTVELSKKSPGPERSLKKMGGKQVGLFGP